MDDGGDSVNYSKTNTQRVTRRSIIRSGSEIRHGRVYEDQPDTTIRTVTPEPEQSGTIFDGNTREDLHASPQTYNVHRRQGSLSGKDAAAPTSSLDEDSAAESRRRPSTRGTRTREDLAPDSSPSSLFSKTRKRLGSITASTQMGNKQDSHSSIGYPSVGNAATILNFAESTPSRPAGTSHRTVSSDTSGGVSGTPLFLNTDASKILQLMKTTCGRMHGILFFRILGTSVWDSGYCAVNVAPGSLVCQKQGEVASTKILVPDLRGCTVRTRYDLETQSTYISVVLPQSGFGVQLRPPVPETFDSWLAALLCWQPLRPKGLQSKMTKQHSVTMSDRRPGSQRRTSDFQSSKSTATLKVGRMALLDGPLPTGSQRHLSKRTADIDSLGDKGPWRRVSCTLHENGTFKLLTEVDAKTICVVRLSQLTRCAVQRLDESVLDAPYCLAIYPQYTIQNSFSRRSQPLVLGLESKAAYEAWFVLLRALTVPELYGPDNRFAEIKGGAKNRGATNSPSMFRIERSLALKIVEAKLDAARVVDFAFGSHGGRVRPSQLQAKEIDVYADVLFGRDLMARTAAKGSSSTAFWAADFTLPDIPSMLSMLSVIIKVGNPAEREWTMVAHHDYDLASADPKSLSGMNGLEIASHDPNFGRVDILVDEIEGEKAIDKWWPLFDKNGQQVGQVLMRVHLSEIVVLMEAEYEQLSRLLHRFDNSLTTQIGQVMNLELKALSEILLDIFQTTDSVQEWIAALIDEEIDGIYKDTPPTRMRFSGRIHSNDSYQSAQHRELLVRDLSRSATMEANLLFRGNSLVSKALDAHMRRLGKAYLEDVLGDKIRQIAYSNPECEVDPAKLQIKDQTQRNWTTLLGLTKSIWYSISTSAAKCPPELRLIFKHIRSCAEDRYGSFIRTVKYTSVSGFLFLRFFCPAVLNPKLFGLVEEIPPERARRTFTLIAKALNVLANMSKFGTKEPWLEPMNRFLTLATPDFKKFIEEICSISRSQPPSLEPQYLAPNQIRARLSPTAREGLPTLPFLLDGPRSCAALVDLWMDSAPDDILNAEVDESVRLFHQTCTGIRRREREAVAGAEPAEKPDNNFEPQWQRILLERQKPQRTVSGNHIEEGFSRLSLEQDITALPQKSDSRSTTSPSKLEGFDTNTGGDTTPSSSTSTADPRPTPYNTLHPSLNPVLTNSTNSSTLSLDTTEDQRNRPLLGSKDGSSKNRFLDMVNPNTKWKPGRGVE
ncbi:hypothetical protein R6Q59_010143 [Mikania micrantha]